MHVHGVWTAAVLLLVMRASGADGFVAVESLYKKPAAIPAQRALMIHRDGVEQLIVESVVDGPGQSYAWIVPVPETPTAFAEGSPDLLNLLQQLFQPTLVGANAYRGTFALTLGVAAAVAAWFAALCVVRPKSRMRLLTALIMFILPVLPALLILSLSQSTKSQVESADAVAEGGEAVRVEKFAVVGSYEVVALEAATPAALNGWLAQNGFADLPAQGERIVKRYIDEGWHFVAAKLRRDGAGLCRPHPLSITFPVSAPVYPMRLTALAESDVELELYVVAEQAVTHPLLHTVFSDCYYFLDFGPSSTPDKMVRAEHFTHRFGIMEPSAYEHFWEGCVFTKLAGTVPSTAMDQDFALQTKQAAPYVLTLYSDEAARRLAWVRALVFWMSAMVAAVFLSWLRLNLRLGVARAAAVIVVPVTVVALAILTYSYYSFPRPQDYGYRIGWGVGSPSGLG